MKYEKPEVFIAVTTDEDIITESSDGQQTLVNIGAGGGTGEGAGGGDTIEWGF